MRNKLYGIWGLGKSGIATANYFIKHNIKFILFDDNQSINSEIIKKLNLGEYFCSPENPKWSNLDYIIKSPGIPLYQNHPIIDIAHNNSIPLISDIELFYLLNPEAKYIGITGTNGKSTTTALIGHILRTNGLNAVVGGNIGIPVMDLEQADIYVLELSSYQLASLDKMRFNIAAILNISADHLDWHGSLERYVEDKFRITKNQKNTDLFIYNANDDLISDFLNKKDIISQKCSFFEIEKPGSYYVGKKFIYSPVSKIKINIDTNNLQGQHNCANSLVALIIAEYLDISTQNFEKSIQTFPGLKHRMQYIGESKNLRFFNDSKATNFDSLEKALMSFDNEILFLILGGKAKENSDFQIINRNKKNIGKIFLIGESMHDFSKEIDNFNISYTYCDTLDLAFARAVKEAENEQKNITILLSPGCASFDQWNNFEERGEAFIKLAAEYISAHKL